ncbi:MAG TPA: multiheme c-type cytochrome [Kofleriaceae bacterium]|nr:multiheme c-type cytochrome [Kofleriaceae bacterium]
MKYVLVVPALALAAVLAACGDDASYKSVEELMKPETCMECHPKHTGEWSGSMHAYAADDPLFRALNAKGQRDTNGSLGSFCVQCHAPIAVALGLTTDGTNLADVPSWARGVTCYACHNVESIEGDHNNPIKLAMDQTMRAGVRGPKPVASPAHATAYSDLVDAESQKSSQLCGSCHDLVSPAGVHLERTYAEWQTTIFSSPDPTRHLSCGSCHMVVRDGPIAEGQGLDVPQRPFGRREHTFPGIDMALTPFPNMDQQAETIERDLKALLVTRLCVLPDDGGHIDVRLDDVGAGHMFPSGATFDRRAWVEVTAYDSDGAVVYSSGTIPPEAPYTDPDQLGDPDLWMMGTPTFDGQDQPNGLFWQIARIDHPGTLLLPAVTTDPGDPRFFHSTEKSFRVTNLLPRIARVRARVLIRPVPMELLDSLMASGDLTTDLRPMVPTHELVGATQEWTTDLLPQRCVPDVP